MKQQHKRSFCAAAAMVLCLCMALGVMGLGFAKWQTTLTASGSVSAAGKWDLAVTDASIKTSSGAAVSLPFSGSLVRANQKEDWEIAGRLTDAYNFSIEAGSISAALVSRIHNEGKQVYAWTVNSSRGASRMVSLQVDNIITDDPALV